MAGWGLTSEFRVLGTLKEVLLHVCEAGAVLGAPRALPAPGDEVLKQTTRAGLCWLGALGVPGRNPREGSFTRPSLPEAASPPGLRC